MENMEAQTPPQATPTPTRPLKIPTSSCSKIMLFANLGSRILTFIFLLIALIVLATMSTTIVTDYGDFTVHFQDVKAYRYLMATIVIGMVYTLVQIGFVLSQVIMGRRLFNGKAMLLFDFYADKVLCGLFATGAGAGFGVTIDLRAQFTGGSDYFDKGAATASLVLFAFLFSELSQIVSSYALPKLNS